MVSAYLCRLSSVVFLVSLCGCVGLFGMERVPKRPLDGALNQTSCDEEVDPDEFANQKHVQRQDDEFNPDERIEDILKKMSLIFNSSLGLNSPQAALQKMRDINHDEYLKEVLAYIGMLDYVEAILMLAEKNQAQDVARERCATIMQLPTYKKKRGNTVPDFFVDAAPQRLAQRKQFFDQLVADAQEHVANYRRITHDIRSITQGLAPRSHAYVATVIAYCTYDYARGREPQYLDTIADGLLLKKIARRFCSVQSAQGSLDLTCLNDDFSDFFGMIIDLAEPLLGKPLKVLKCSKSRLSCLIPQTLGTLTSLEEIDFSGNQFFGTIPPSIMQLPKLKILDLSSNRLTGFVPEQITELRHIQKISFANNELSGLIPSGINKMATLQEIDLSHNKLSGAVPADLMTAPALKKVNLAYNKLEGVLPDAYSASLASIDCSHNKLTGELPEALSWLVDLKHLNLSWNKFKGELFACFDGLPELEVLLLDHNTFSGSIPAGIAAAEKLFNLNLAFNTFSGSIPQELFGVQRLQLLCLSHNRLEGALVPLVEKLANLKVLDVSYNDLAGELPKTLINLKNINILDLSYNRFEGCIPAGLDKLDGCHTINLQMNNLDCSDLAERLPALDRARYFLIEPQRITA